MASFRVWYGGRGLVWLGNILWGPQQTNIAGPLYRSAQTARRWVAKTSAPEDLAQAVFLLTSKQPDWAQRDSVAFNNLVGAALNGITDRSMLLAIANGEKNAGTELECGEWVRRLVCVQAGGHFWDDRCKCTACGLKEHQLEETRCARCGGEIFEETDFHIDEENDRRTRTYTRGLRWPGTGRQDEILSHYARYE